MGGGLGVWTESNNIARAIEKGKKNKETYCLNDLKTYFSKPF